MMESMHDADARRNTSMLKVDEHTVANLDVGLQQVAKTCHRSVEITKAVSLSQRD